MIIAIDIGNTNIVLGCMDPDSGELFFTARLASDRVKTSDEYASLMGNMFHHLFGKRNRNPDIFHPFLQFR